MIFKYPVVFESGADYRSIGDRELFGHIFEPDAGIGEDRCVGNGVLDVLEHLQIGLAACCQARNAEDIGTIVENR